MPPILWHQSVPVPGLVWLPAFAVLGIGIGHFVLSDDERLLANVARVLVVTR